MVDIPGYDIRYTQLTDIAPLREWVSVPEILHWFPMANEKEIEDAIQCWIGFCRYASSLTTTIDGVPCGIGTLFLMPYKKVAHHCLFKMVVDPKHQRKGIGSSLLKNLQHLAKSFFKIELMHIEIFAGNPIEHILKKFHFQEFARQERYVKDKERYYTRILMECYL